MKTSIDLPDDLYRALKAKSALEGLAVREVATALFSAWVEGRAPGIAEGSPPSSAATEAWLDEWQALGKRISKAAGREPTLVKQLMRDRR